MIMRNKFASASFAILFGIQITNSAMMFMKYQEEKHHYLSKFKSLDEKESLYSILQVPPKADFATIKSNYRKLSLKW